MVNKTLLKKWSARIAVAAVAGGLLVGTSLATSASATVCYTKGCGGAITNHSTRYFFVTNNWCLTQTTPWYGDHLSCKVNGVLVPQTWSQRDWNSYFLLPTGDTTLNYDHYYDTDAFRIDGHCTVVVQDSSGSATRIYNSSSTPMWHKIRDFDKLTVTLYTC